MSDSPLNKITLLHKIITAVEALITRNIRIEFERIPITIRNASYRKILNWILVELSILLRLRHPRGWPTNLQIEPTTRCNMKCSHCPASRKTDESNGDLIASGAKAFQSDHIDNLVDETRRERIKTRL